MQINKLLGSFVLGTSMLLAGCSNKTELEKFYEKLQIESKNNNVEYLISVLNESASIPISNQTAHLLLKNHSQDKRVIFTFLKNQELMDRYNYIFSNLTAPYEIFPELLESLDSDNPSVRYYSIRFISKFGIDAQRAQDKITQILNEDTSETVRYEAAIALGQIKANSKGAFIALKKALKYNGDFYNVSDEASKSLQQIAPNAMPSLIEAFREEKGLDLFSAIQNLGEPALPHLMKSLNGEENYVNRANLVLLLGDIVSNSKNESKQKEITKVLINYLKDKNKDVRYNAATGLWLIGPNAKEAIPVLEEISRNDRYEWVRERAKDALESIRK